eukprot:Hpha_TRINITY_DN16018_c3_g4::TRINITY_DN16018_c3_g4_i1::g.118207::m.118207
MGKGGGLRARGRQPKVGSQDKTRKINKKGKVKRKRGDPRSMTSFAVKSTVVRQKKGGKVVYGDRVCTIHKLCDCVQRANPTINRPLMSADPIIEKRGKKKGTKRMRR